MLEIIKYYVLYRHGLPILAISSLLILLNLVFFKEDSMVLHTIIFAVFYPYIDMFSSKKDHDMLKNIDSKLPLSFNKVWMAKSICLSLYLTFLSSLYALVLFTTSPDKLYDITNFTFFVLTMFVVFFVVGKVKLYRRGNVKLIGQTILSIILLFIMLVVVLMFPFILRPMDNLISYNLITFALPLAIIHLIDYLMAKSNKFNVRSTI